MDNLFIFFIVFGGAGLLIFIFIFFKTFTSPRKLAALEIMLERGNTKAAIKYAKAILARNERNLDAHWYLGECYIAEKRPDLAVVEYNYIVNSGKFTNIATEKKVRQRLAATYLTLRMVDEAQKEFILLSKIEPNNYENYYNIAQLFEERNYTDSALKNYKKVISLNPQHSMAYMRIGFIMYKKQMFPEAKKAFITSLKYDPQNYACYYYLGLISKLSGDSNASLIQFRKAQNDTKLRQRALLEIGSIFAVRGDLIRASQELEKAVRLGDEDLPAILGSRYLLAKCYEANKDLLKAVEQWEQIYAKNPRYRDVAEKLAMYSDLRADDRLKDFLTAPQSKFQQYCTNLVEKMGLAIQDIFLRNQDLVEISALEIQSRWRNAKKSPSIVKIFRSAEPIGYDVIRGLYDQMRKMNAMRSICITSSRFTKSAIEFAQIRPIDLIDKEELVKLLHKIPL